MDCRHVLGDTTLGCQHLDAPVHRAGGSDKMLGWVAAQWMLCAKMHRLRAQPFTNYRTVILYRFWLLDYSIPRFWLTSGKLRLHLSSPHSTQTRIPAQSRVFLPPWACCRLEHGDCVSMPLLVSVHNSPNTNELVSPIAPVLVRSWCQVSNLGDLHKVFVLSCSNTEPNS